MRKGRFKVQRFLSMLVFPVIRLYLSLMMILGEKGCAKKKPNTETHSAAEIVPDSPVVCLGSVAGYPPHQRGH